jgi:hypothetical protein
MIGSGIGYSIFKSLEQGIGPELASIPAILIILISVFIAVFKNSEMTFLPFLLNMLRVNLNTGIRVWSKGTESYDMLRVGYVTLAATAKVRADSKGAFTEVEDAVSERLAKI